jgi:hypothetical protein
VSYNFSLGSPAIVNAATIHVSTKPATLTEAKGQMLREKTLGECILKVERAVVNDFPDLLKSFPVDFPLRASPLDRFYVRLRLLYSLQQKKQARSRMKCSEQQPRL